MGTLTETIDSINVFYNEPVVDFTSANYNLEIVGVRRKPVHRRLDDGRDHRPGAAPPDRAAVRGAGVGVELAGVGHRRRRYAPKRQTVKRAGRGTPPTGRTTRIRAPWTS